MLIILFEKNVPADQYYVLIIPSILNRKTWMWHVIQLRGVSEQHIQERINFTPAITSIFSKNW